MYFSRTAFLCLFVALASPTHAAPDPYCLNVSAESPYESERRSGTVFEQLPYFLNVATGASTSGSTSGWGGARQPHEVVDGDRCCKNSCQTGQTFPQCNQGWACGVAYEYPTTEWKDFVVTLSRPHVVFESLISWKYLNVPKTFYFQMNTPSGWNTLVTRDAVGDPCQEIKANNGDAFLCIDFFEPVVGTQFRVRHWGDKENNIIDGDGIYDNGWLFEFELHGFVDGSRPPLVLPPPTPNITVRVGAGAGERANCSFNAANFSAAAAEALGIKSSEISVIDWHCDNGTVIVDFVLRTGSTPPPKTKVWTVISWPVLSPNMTVGVPTQQCNASLFDAKVFAEQLAAAYSPALNIDPANVIVIEARCIGDVMEVTFAIWGTDGSIPLTPPLTSSVTSNVTTWSVINWPKYTTTEETLSSPPAAVADTTGSGKSGSSVSVVAGVAGGLIGCAACLACAGVLLWKKRLDRGIREQDEVALSALQHSSTQRLTAMKLLGAGNFGAVYEGRMDGINWRVAIKEVRSGSANEMQREADMLMRCQHEFIVQLLGVVRADMIGVAPGCPVLGRDDGSVCMLTELCEYGSLRDALLKARSGSPGVAVLSLETVSASWLLLVFWQVSEAMRFLTQEAKVLHRDLAARNVLLARARDGYASGLANSDGLGICARVSDFGLSESMYADYYDRQQGAGGSISEALPLRWTAPEALLKHKFSEKSDVYSFGVLMVETLNMGALPMNQLLNSELIASIQDAVHQEPRYLAAFDFDKPSPFIAAGTQEPLDEGLWALVLRCVSVRAEDRPTFLQCSAELKQYLCTVSTTVLLPPPRQALSLTDVRCAPSSAAAEEAKYGHVADFGAAAPS